MMLDSDIRVARRNHTRIDSRIVTVRVGGKVSERRRHDGLAPKLHQSDQSPQDAKDFSVHEGILREHSLFFRTALDAKWREGRLGIVDLPHDDVDVVGAYVDWLYFRTIASKPTAARALPMDDGEYQHLARLYTFGEKVQADAFCDDVLTAMTLKTDDVADDGTRTFPSHSAITTLYEGTPADSPARKFVVDMYAEFGMNAWVPGETDLSHPEFLIDLVHAFMLRRPMGSAHKQSNYPRRSRWHKREQGRAEFLRTVSSRDRVPG
jgi:hypothetical protein